MKPKILHSKAFRIIMWMFVIACALVLLVGCFYAVKGYKMYKEAIAETPIDQLEDNIRARTEHYVSFDELPQLYVNAVVSAEDKRFPTHHGVDYIAICRAVLVDIKSMSFKEGGSTITQQLAKNELFTQQKHIERKFAEIFAAFAIERTYTKNEIFEMYVNSIYFGADYYGIYDASMGYFDCTPSELEDYEAVMLAGIPNAPSVYSLYVNIPLAVRRMNFVLQKMIDCNIITEYEADQISARAFMIQFELDDAA